MVNTWESIEEKLKWLRVRPTGRAQAVFRKLPEDVRGDFSKCVDALHRCFDPDSKKELYIAELIARRKQTGEDWASFGDALRTLADKAYSDLEEKARERLALN